MTARHGYVDETFTAAGLRSTVYDADRRYRTQAQARAACLWALVNDLAAAKDDTLIVLDEDATLVASDRRLLYQAARAVRREATLRYEHRRAATERLLGVPDAFAWSWAKGHRWRSQIRPAATVKNV